MQFVVDNSKSGAGIADGAAAIGRPPKSGYSTSNNVQRFRAYHFGFVDETSGGVIEEHSMEWPENEHMTFSSS